MLKKLIFIVLVTVFTVHFNALYAGNHEVIHPTRGNSIGWNNSTQIPYWIDAGPLGKLSNIQARAMVEKMMQAWEAVETAEVGFSYQGELAHDVTEENIADYIGMTSCGNSSNTEIPENIVPIVFDSNGKIIEYLIGLGSSAELGGLATLRCFEGTNSDPDAIYQGMVIINGEFIDGLTDADGSPEDLTENVIAGIMLHEVGHLIGLDHSVVNDELFNDVSDGVLDPEYSKYLPAMLPTVLRKSNSATTLHPDDISSISVLYPSGSYLSDVGTIEGEVLNSRLEDVRKVNVIARRDDDPLCETVSAVTGRRCTPLKDGMGHTNFNSASCNDRSKYGDYKIEGLLPGNYTVEVEELSTGWIRSGMYPSSLSIDLPGDAEFYNDGDTADEDILASTLIEITAGFRAANIDIVLNAAEASSDQLDSIPLDTFEEGPSSRCTTDPIDFTALINDPNADLVTSLSPAAAESGEGAEGAKAGCQLLLAEGSEKQMFLIFLLLGLLVVLRSLRCRKDS